MEREYRCWSQPLVRNRVPAALAAMAMAVGPTPAAQRLDAVLVDC
jgi:hypothetical protein